MLKDLRRLKPPASRSLWFLRAQRDALLEYIIEAAATPTYEYEARRLLEDMCTDREVSLSIKKLERYFNSGVQYETRDLIRTFRSLCTLIGKLEHEYYERAITNAVYFSTLNLAPT